MRSGEPAAARARLESGRSPRDDHPNPEDIRRTDVGSLAVRPNAAIYERYAENDGLRA